MLELNNKKTWRKEGNEKEQEQKELCLSVDENQ